MFVLFLIACLSNRSTEEKIAWQIPWSTRIVSKFEKKFSQQKRYLTEKKKKKVAKKRLLVA